MGYCIEDSIVRVDLFKPSGKWAYNGAVNMKETWDTSSPDDALEIAMDRGGIEGVTVNWRTWLAEGGMIVCLNPCHKYAYPVMLKERNTTPTR